MNCEIPDIQAGFRKGRGTRDQIANVCWIVKKAREFQQNIYFCFIDDTKAFDCVDHNKLWKMLKEMGTQEPPGLPPEKIVCRSGGLVFPSLSELSTVYCDPHSQRLWHSQ